MAVVERRRLLTVIMTARISIARAKPSKSMRGARTTSIASIRMTMARRTSPLRERHYLRDTPIMRASDGTVETLLDANLCPPQLMCSTDLTTI